ncbi:IclR family transcriptional regulator [Gordonia liuliyuniae]|uniref:IclR family transcriptional regulator n=1 Tax=Gordonia liuliyuniae TaxID=2911517 RepID=A0ABS9IQ91_9ACTN|nr:IclR family transcriptional regulator [Gordonia liuliyuniae]MCF8587726.1 IclR family transcriptional regulator [Gordonia liuliyuniae]
MNDDRESGTPPSMLDRIDLILDAVEEAGFLTLSGVMERTGLARSTTHRLLLQMERRKWLFRVGTNYELGVRLFGLGTSGLRTHWFYRRAMPTLSWLQLQTGYIVHMAYLDGADCVYWEKLGSGRFQWEVPTRIGAHRPAHTTSVGKSLLAVQSDDYLRSIEPFAELTPNTVTSTTAIRQEIDEVRKRGYAVDRGESIPNVGCFGTTVSAASDDSATARRTSAAISICVPLAELDTRLIPILLAAKKRISQNMRVNPMIETADDD